jgi:hypothetical protein
VAVVISKATQAIGVARVIVIRSRSCQRPLQARALLSFVPRPANAAAGGSTVRGWGVVPPNLEGVLIVPVEGLERGLQPGRELEQVQLLPAGQAISMAMTVALQVPVASLRASLESSGLASLLGVSRCSRKRLPALERIATSVSQIVVSTASI